MLSRFSIGKIIMYEVFSVKSHIMKYYVKDSNEKKCYR